MSCPCGSGSTETECCGPFLAGSSAPPTAEALMRSRYTAFVRGEIDYLLDTTAPETTMDRADTESWSRDSEWLGLRVVETQRGGPQDDDGTVEFVATFRLGGNEQFHHELASFRRDDGRWLFVDGETPQQAKRREGPKIGRNDPCPCGSGKKYKKCCGAA